jgi:hypothetical protein
MFIAETLAAGDLSASANYTVNINYRDGKSVAGTTSAVVQADSPQGAVDVAINQLRDLYGQVAITAVAVYGPGGYRYQARQINNRWTIETEPAPSRRRPLVIAAVGLGVLTLIGIGVAIAVRRRRR